MTLLRHILFQLVLLAFVPLRAQVTGIVLDSKTRQPLDYANVYYDGKNVGTQTDENGRFIIKEDSLWHTLTIYSPGYNTLTLPLKPFGQNKDLTITLRTDNKTLSGVTVTAQKSRYNRKNNPAVELMRKVIANKRSIDLHAQDFCSYTRYEKMTFALNEVSDKIFDTPEHKPFAFLKDHVERSPQTDKLILPLTIDETLSEIFYRKDPKSQKQVIKGESHKGVTELVNTGEILTTTLKDVFTDVDIYQNECRLLQFMFRSPIADNAISFYRYYIQDTLLIQGEKVVDIGFLPNNQQDFGFSGHLHILLDSDSTYAVRRAELTIPRRSDVNFVTNMLISLDFTPEPTGARIATTSDMLVELQLARRVGKFQVERHTRISNISFEPLPQSLFKNLRGDVLREPDASMQDDDFWNKYRHTQLTRSEKGMDSFLDKLTHIKGFSWMLFGFRALVENFVETGDSLHPSRVDIGPINTILSANHYDGFRLRASALTTANLSPHLFANGYLAYGTRTHQPYWRAQLTYAFAPKSYLPREYPQHNLSVSFVDDVFTPFDRYVPTDKDNMFTAFHASTVDQYNHTRELNIDYVREFHTGVKLQAHFTHTRLHPVDALFYQPLNGLPTPDLSATVAGITTAQFQFGVTYEPHVTYINTKQRRIKVNHDAPILSLLHTHALKGFLGGEYRYDLTELTAYKRLYLQQFGKFDLTLQAGALMGKVPYPLLIHPAANTSYIIEDNTFLLLSNYEFLNDRYATLMTEWDLNGWLFNRIPLFHRLKWRECVGINLLWGQLTSRNNPAASQYTDGELFYLPGHFLSDGTYQQNTVLMDTSKPYAEWRVGIHNIFKLIEIDYVRRLTYRYNPNTQKWGIRFKVRMTF